MPRSFPLIALLLLSSCGSGTPASSGPDGALSGDPNDPVELAIPQLRYAPGEDGDWMNTLVLSFELGVTVSEANAVLASLDAQVVGGVRGVEGEAAGVLVVRTRDETAEALTQTLGVLEEDPRVAFVAPDLPLEPAMATTQPSPAVPANWVWDDPPAGPNRHLEMSNVPPMWNLADAARKQGPPVPVVILDRGFFPHAEFSVEWAGSVDEHGTAVGGVVAAPWNDGVGIDGVSPHVTAIPDEVASVAVLATAVPEVFGHGAAVVNISLSYGNGGPELVEGGWHASFINAGAVLIEAMRAFEAGGGALPVVVSAAGNASIDIPVDATFRSPMNTAAMELGAANIIVVEGVVHAPGTDAGAAEARFSHYGAPISAPAVVTTLDLAGGYAEKAGTSFAAPMVAGTVAFMYALLPDLPRPTLVDNPAMDALKATARPMPESAALAEDIPPRPVAPRLDAYAAVLDLDRVRGGTQVLEHLCDIDDGTPDGNTRVDPFTGQVVLDADADGDGGLGDGVVDMRDFRRFRDWLLVTEGGGALDGAADHVKRDLNLDGWVREPADEVYPRADFNGDGRIDRAAKRHVPGALGREATDLEMFAAVFSDPEVEAARLRGHPRRSLRLLRSPRPEPGRGDHRGTATLAGGRRGG